MSVGAAGPAGRLACAMPRPGCPQGTHLRLFWRLVRRQLESRGGPAHGWGRAPGQHSLIPRSAIGLQFGTFRRWRAGIEVDWRAHPGSESGTCFRTNRSCRLAPAHQSMKTRLGRWKCLGVVDATLPLWIPASARMTKRCAGMTKGYRERRMRCCRSGLSRIGVRDTLS